jgi:four helix bundle protein
MKPFRDLQVWQKSHAVTLRVYEVTSKFPKTEQFGLTSQIQRAASSVAANIAEGCGRNSDAELRRFLEISMGSATELEYHLLLAKDLKLLVMDSYEQMDRDVVEIKKMLAGLIKKLKSDR